MFGTAGKPRQKRDITGFLFILPTLLVLAVLLLYPVLASIFYSFTSKHLLKPTYGFVGLKNYIKVLKDPAFYSAFWVSNSLDVPFFAGTAACWFHGSVGIKSDSAVSKGFCGRF